MYPPYSRWGVLTLALLNKMPRPLLISSQSDYLIRGFDRNLQYLMKNSADPDQLASSEANWSGSTLFAKIEHVVFSKRKVKHYDRLMNSIDPDQTWSNVIRIYTVHRHLSVQIFRVFKFKCTIFSLPFSLWYLSDTPFWNHGLVHIHRWNSWFYVFRGESINDF